MSFFAVVTNLFLIIFATTIFEGYTHQQKVAAFFVLEHVFLAMKMVLDAAIPDIDEATAEKMRLDDARKEAINMHLRFEMDEARKADANALKREMRAQKTLACVDEIPIKSLYHSINQAV
jgi:ribosomal 50S subunit-associated protein YjgA (DUF615 family)